MSASADYNPDGPPSPPGLTREVLWTQRAVQFIGEGAEKLVDDVDELHNEVRKLNHESFRSNHELASQRLAFDAGVSAAVLVLRGLMTVAEALKCYTPITMAEMEALLNLDAKETPPASARCSS